ncbi:pre-mRNA-splicing factor ISY1 [Entamoeba marina]
MARNQEKANSMLHRWKQMQTEERIGNKKIKPKNPDQCKTLSEAKFWRQTLVKEISKKIGEIQNVALGENAIRVLNVDINRLNKERAQWERKIVELGGVNTDSLENDERPLSSEKFIYFGAARFLPEAKETSVKSDKSKLKEDIRNLGVVYYGMDHYETNEMLEDEGRLEDELKIKVLEQLKTCQPMDEDD